MADKFCNDCNYYKDLYSVFRGQFIKYCGFCGNQEVYSKHNKNKFNPKPCDKWEQKISVIEEQGESIERVIKRISKSLAEVACILKSGQK